MRKVPTSSSVSSSVFLSNSKVSWIWTNCTILALCTLVCKSCSYNIKGTPDLKIIARRLYTNDALCLLTTSHRRTQREKVRDKLYAFLPDHPSPPRSACESRLSIMCSASSQRQSTALSMCQPPINYVAAFMTHCIGAFSA